VSVLNFRNNKRMTQARKEGKEAVRSLRSNLKNIPSLLSLNTGFPFLIEFKFQNSQLFFA